MDLKHLEKFGAKFELFFKKKKKFTGNSDGYHIGTKLLMEAWCVQSMLRPAPISGPDVTFVDTVEIEVAQPG